MNNIKKVVWSEGMFLRPQHFQGQDRYFEACLRMKSYAICAYDWGFLDMSINKQSLMQSYIALEHASGIMPDGTLFDTKHNQVKLEPLQIDKNTSNSLVFLSVALKTPDVPEISFEPAKDFHRYCAIDEKTFDNTATGPANEIQLAQLQMHLALEKDLNTACVHLPIARIIECLPNGQLILDKNFIPPILHGQKNSVVKAIIDETYGLLTQRAKTLSEKLIQSDIDNHVGLVEYLMLQSINRYEHVVYSLSQESQTHPEKIYKILAMLAGDLAIFTTEKTNQHPVQYLHNNLEKTLYSLLSDIRRSLAIIIDQKAIQIPFKEEKFGIKSAQINDSNLLSNAQFIISIYAEMPAEQLRKLFLTQAKFSPIDKISDLVNLQLPGLILSPLGAAPRQIPYSANRHYFEIDTSSELWSQLSRTCSLAVHIAGDFPGLKIECWALRN